MEVIITKVLKWMILAISLSMFCYQARIAVYNLVNPPVIDSTQVYDVKDVKPPLITICPMHQYNHTKLNQFGFYRLSDLLLGDYGLINGSYLIGWGAKHNITFEQMIGEFLYFDDNPGIYFTMKDETWVNADYEISYYPLFGHCFDIYNYTITGDIKLVIEMKSNGNISEDWSAMVYLTDRNLRTRSSVHTSSHWGSSIVIRNGYTRKFVVEVELQSNYDPRDPDDCQDFTDDEFDQCVDENLQDVWKPTFNCNPPWLSPKDKCSAVNNTIDSFSLDMIDTVNGILEMDTFPAKTKCFNPCTVTQPKVLSNGGGEYYSFQRAILKIKFANQVVHKVKILGYDFSAFLVDMGSSLGLWFGLSVFGIKDLGITVLQWAMKRRVQRRGKYFNA
jgi:hypothetical protein